MKISFDIDDAELLPLLGNPNPHEDAKYIVIKELRKRLPISDDKVHGES